MRSLFLALALASPAAAQAVWVVDHAQGAGATHAQVQPAVLAAADGDVILVRAGTYGAFTVLGKGLTISAELGATVRIQGGFAIRGLAADQGVLVRGLEVVNPTEEGAQLKNDDGPVLIEDCVLPGGVGDNAFGALVQADSFSGALVDDCAEVVFARCTLVGGVGLDLKDEDWHYAAGDGGHGVEVVGGDVSLFGCTLVGADGGTIWDTVSDTGGRAGDAAHVSSGSVFASGCSLTGGDGGHADSDLWGCGSGGAGGDGIHLAFSATGTARHQDCTFAPGAGGAPGAAGCGWGANGVNVDVGGGTEVALPGTARALAVSSPHREGEVATFTATGAPGEAVLAAVSTAPSHLPLDPFAGVLVVDLALVVLPLGTVPAGGELAAPVPVPAAADPAVLARRLFVQTAHVDGAPAVWLGHASGLLLLDDSL